MFAPELLSDSLANTHVICRGSFLEDFAEISIPRDNKITRIVYKLNDAIRTNRMII